MEAMEAVAGRAAIPPPSRAPVPREEKPRHLLLPPPAPDNRAMLQYLAGRGIDQEILDYCVQTGRIYESRNKGHSNVAVISTFPLPCPLAWRIQQSICASAPLMSCPTLRSASWTGSTGGGTICCPWPGCTSRRKRWKKASCRWPLPGFWRTTPM